MRPILLFKTLVTTVQVATRVRFKPWNEITEKLDRLKLEERRALNSEERYFVFRWSRRLAKRISSKNVCMICSLTLLELDGAPLELHLGIFPEGSAHAWIRIDSECLTTDQNLPRDSSLVFKNDLSA